tara:strand:+ start:938 stop:1054 length:117 start_codon:yes stop_codon:yes gene_type:complete
MNKGMSTLDSEEILIKIAEDGKNSASSKAKKIVESLSN